MVHQLSKVNAVVIVSAELQDQVYRSIRQKIMDGRVQKPRDLSRRVLEAELGVSSTCVQVALARLEGEGLLESRPQSGTFLRRIDAREHGDHYQVRQWIEPPAAAQAASRITPAQLKRLRQSCADYAAYEEYWRHGPAVMTPEVVDRAVAAENAFHGTIMEAAGNDTATHIIENLRVFVYNRLMNLELPPAVVAHLTGLTVKEHHGILAALEQHNARLAEQRMRRHLQRAAHYARQRSPA
jgi:DNA-binding GntR family transcriptional regulator